jgi:hypothetical protein
MTSAHARLGPSSAHRWLRCPASIRLAEQLPPASSSPAAVAGTVMHTVFERILLNQHDFTASEIEYLAELDVSEMRARTIVGQAVKAARYALRQLHMTEFVTETRVDPGAVIGRDDFWGTADLIAADATTQTLLVADLKTGRGRVDVEFNDQLLSYALGASRLLQFEPTRIVLAIFQPAIHGDRAAMWQTNWGVLREFSEFALKQASKTDQANTAPTPSQEACQWCPARAVCPALTMALHP